MDLSEQDEKKLGRLAGEIDAITQKLKIFRQNSGHRVGIHLTKEYLALQEKLEGLEKEFNSIPKINN